MKPILLVLSLLATTLLIADPALRFLETSYDFGTFREEDGKVSHVFRFVNSGAAAFHLFDVTSSCGCTVPKWSARAIAPGAADSIVAVYDPESRPGDFEKHLYVYVDSDPKTPVVLTLKGHVIEDLNRFTFKVGDLLLKQMNLNAGKIAVGQQRELKLGCHNPTTAPMRVRFGRIPPEVTAFCKPEVVPPGNSGMITVYFIPTPGTALGEWTGRVEIIVDQGLGREMKGEVGVLAEVVPKSTGDRKDAGSMSMDASASVSSVVGTDRKAGQDTRPPVAELDCDRMSFTPDGKNPIGFVKVANRGGGKLRITRIEAPGGVAVTGYDSEVPPGESTRFRIDFLDPGNPLRKPFDVLIHTSDPKHGFLTLRFEPTK
jgi:hypothetical protein